MKALIKVGYGCNENCSFCHTLDIREIEGSRSEVEAKIRRAAALGHSMVVLSGGEPTIRPELVHWAELVAELGLGFGLVTNGQRLSYSRLVDRLVGLNLRYVYLSLHGGSAAIHNRMTRSRAFDAALGAVETLSGHGLDLTVNCVVTRHNLEHLPPLVDAMRPFPEWTVQFSMVEPKGGARHQIERLVPPVAEVAERVKEAITYGQATSPEQQFRHGGLPLCLMGGHEAAYADLRSHHFLSMTEVGEPDFFPIDDHNKVQTATCRGCALSGPCPGLYKTYEEAFGDGELTPRFDSGNCSSSFNFAFDRRLPDMPPERCWLLENGVEPWDRGRDLFLRHGSRLALYRADTRDFSDSDIAAIKHDQGQIYFDASDKPALDDFARDLVLLARSGLCNGCEHRTTCSGLFEPVFEDVFTAVDQDVQEILLRLEGRVLDVGCGRAPYAVNLRRRVEAGALHYTGVDPDAQAIESLRVQHPWGRFLIGEVAALGDELPGPIDHVLILRSWNHLPDPQRVLGVLLPRLRKGGTLTVVDNVAFGLARSRRQTQRAESSAAQREHWRNHDAADARLAIEDFKAYGLSCLVAKNVEPGVGNQWLLHYRVEGMPS